MLPWTPPASLSMQQQQNNQQGAVGNHQNELHSIGMQHQQQQQQSQQQGGMHYGGQQQQQQSQMQQHQQQQQMGQQQQQQQQMHQQQQSNDPNAPGQQAQQQPLTLSQVLHFLQTEWRRYERERNEWEIERGEMRARIALLEGERRGTENLKTDLMRRVKMLEYALRAERNKYITSANQQHALSKEKDAQAQKVADDKEKEREGKEGSESSKDGSRKDGDEKENKEKEKPSAIPSDKKKLIKDQTGAANAASGRASPALTAGPEEGAAVPGVPDVVVSNASQPTSTTSAHPPQQSQTAVQRVGSTTSLVSLPNGQGSSIGLGPGSTMNLGPLSWNPSLGRDPRGRAKSREYLKQCLQEITYLTSATALNPLPDRTPAGLPRPRKHMIDIPPQMAPQGNSGLAAPGQPLLAGSIPEPHSSGGNTVIPLPQPAGAAPPAAVGTISQLNVTNATSDAVATPAQPEVAGSNPSSGSTINNAGSVGPVNGQAQATEVLPTSDFTLPRTAADVFSSVSSNDDSSESATMTADAAARLTAIFRPESSEEWKKAIQKAGQQQQNTGIVGSDGESAGQTLSMKEAQAQYGQEKDATSSTTNGTAARGRSDTVQSAATSTSGAAASNESVDDHKIWKPRRTLRAHLDAARCIAFDRSERSEDVSLASGGDDCTVKLWRLPLHSVAATNRSQHLPDSEPSVTYRGHTGPVTSMCLTPSSGSNRIYSSSLDSTILGWQMPPRDRDTYAPFDSNLNAVRLEGHTDGVWDVCLVATAGSSHSANGISSGSNSHKEILASASADGTVKIWDVSPQSDDPRGGATGGALKLSWTAAGTEGSEEIASTKPIPTSLALCQTDMTKLAVAYQDGVVRIFDTETGKLVLSLEIPESSSGETAQINRIVSHPTLPMLITANEDNYIRLFDLKSGACTHSLIGHTDAVTSLDVDPSGLTIASASHDCTVRFWDLLQTRSCIQEISNSHRTKGDEGVLDVKYHPTLPFVASSGADGGVRVYG